ncbi:MAG TPA: adenylate kinase [Phycisphaerae bacterium]|jgi:adenylate kinase|nr:adenylate kinase [Phycisphaerae bacterium]
MRIALLGPPGSGKGTQAQRICENFGLTHLASGDILRAEKASGSEMGRKIRDFIDNGLLVPDDLMIELMKQKILGLKTGFVLDGFPRTLPQAQSLNRMLFDVDRPLMLVLNFVVNPKILSRRFEGRRICPVCLSVYHIDSKPPLSPGICDLDGAELIIREDDKPEVVHKRIATYQETMAPLIAYYAQLGNFKTVDTSGTVDEVTTLVLEKIRRHFEDE